MNSSPTWSNTAEIMTTDIDKVQEREQKYSAYIQQSEAMNQSDDPYNMAPFTLIIVSVSHLDEPKMKIYIFCCHLFSITKKSRILYAI